jgi:hypothetical protein
LEADAAREADEAARSKMLSSELGIDSRSLSSIGGPEERVEMLTDAPADAAMRAKDMGVSGSGPDHGTVKGVRPTRREIMKNMLGFQSEGPPPEVVIADELEGEDLEIQAL